MSFPARKSTPAISTEDFAFLQRFIMQRAGIVLSDSKAYLAETRLTAVIRKHKIPTLNALVQRLRDSPHGPLGGAVIDAFTTNETSFFRDRHPFDLLKQTLLPRLIKARASRRRLRLWSAASSTGQEAYSLAMILNCHFPALIDWDVEILGTDISEEALETAREGRYRALHLNRGLSEELRQRYFIEDGRQWRISERLRRLTRFEPLNLCKDRYPLQRFDVILLRNVLIYFDNPTQQAVLSKLHACLAPDGALFLGGAEAALQPPADLYMPNINGRTIWHSPKLGGK